MALRSVAVAFLVLPGVCATLLTGAAATWAVLTLIAVAGLGLGVVDARVFRHTWAFPVMTGIVCWVGLLIWANNDGAWVYAPGAFLLCLLGNRLAARRATGE